MTTEENLLNRSGAKCELCDATGGLEVANVPPHSDESPDHSILLCETCRQQLSGDVELDVHHWRCLNESMWSPIPAVQVTAWRLLHQLKSNGWANELLDTLYLDEETLAWAQAGQPLEDDSENIKHVDSNGAVLSPGDTVVLTKDLNVKGASFTAKRGTSVRGISLVPDNAEQIEGRVNGQHIVILTKFVKKSS